MSNERVRGIVDKLSNDADEYRKALAREHEHWGRVLSRPGRAAALEKDRAAVHES